MKESTSEFPTAVRPDFSFEGVMKSALD